LPGSSRSSKDAHLWFAAASDEETAYASTMDAKNRHVERATGKTAQIDTIGFGHTP
jgi:hypothetical protein